VTTPRDNDPGIDLARVAKLVDALEKDLARAKPDEAHRRKLLREIEAIRNALTSPPKHSGIREGLHAIRQTMEHASGTLAGEMWRDAPYLAEIGRILGLP
jgi:hypothetical protein